MDGAEACYPLYAAAAKAVYQDIAHIASNWADSGERAWTNGQDRHLYQHRRGL